MSFEEIYHFLFETYAGIGVLVAASLVICVIIAAILELRTRKAYVDRGDDPKHDPWSIFADDDEDDEEAEESNGADAAAASNGAAPEADAPEADAAAPEAAKDND